MPVQWIFMPRLARLKFGIFLTKTFTHRAVGEGNPWSTLIPTGSAAQAAVDRQLGK